MKNVVKILLCLSVVACRHTQEDSSSVAAANMTELPCRLGSTQKLDATPAKWDRSAKFAIAREGKKFFFKIDKPKLAKIELTETSGDEGYREYSLSGDANSNWGIYSIVLFDNFKFASFRSDDGEFATCGSK